MDQLGTVRDQTLSLWQSVVQEVTARVAGVSLAAARKDPRVIAATALAATIDANAPLVAAAPVAMAAGLPAPVAEGFQCAKLAFRLAWATLNNDVQGVLRLREQLAAFGQCDLNWITETVAQFLHYYPHNHASIPYRSGEDYVLDVKLPPDATIGIIGDWGTGSQTAADLLRQVANKNPHLVIHLGDIYYSGTQPECTGFLQDVRAILGPKVPVYSLSGNHDMYSGGVGYYWLVDQLKQRSSYFCIRNDNWQFLAMDTGYNDFNPFTVELSVPGLTRVEATWHLDKIAQAGTRKTVLMSHHPLFSAFEPIGGNKINDELLRIFQPVLGDIAVWFWGHEHRLDIYGSYTLNADGKQATLQRGRCVGCSAIPIRVTTKHYQKCFDDVPLVEYPKGSGKTIQLGNDGAIYNLGYAVMQLQGASATISYYQHTDEQHPLYIETLS